jgi:hypothetical protein
LLLRFLSLALISSGCQTLITEKDFFSFNTTNCIETHLIGSGYAILDESHCTDILLAEDVRPDPDNPGQTLPAHGAAIFMSADTFNAFKAEHEVMCRELGKTCVYGAGNNATPTPTPSP